MQGKYHATVLQCLLVIDGIITQIHLISEIVSKPFLSGVLSEIGFIYYSRLDKFSGLKPSREMLLFLISMIKNTITNGIFVEFFRHRNGFFLTNLRNLTATYN